jgi:hypothetical protein
MRRCSENWSCLLLLLASACSAGGDVAPQRFGSSNAAGNGSAGTSADTGNAGSSAPLGNNSTDNPTMLVMTSSSGGAGGAGGAKATAGAGADPTMCKSGMFCMNTTPDAIDCGHISIDTNITMIQRPGNVLVVFDRSTSMQQDWNGMPKYQAAGNAVIAALTRQTTLARWAATWPIPSTGFPVLARAV